VLHCVWYRNLVNEEVLAHWGAVAPKTNKQTNSVYWTVPYPGLKDGIYFNVKEFRNTPWRSMSRQHLDRKWESRSAYSGTLTIWKEPSLFIDIQMFSPNSSNFFGFISYVAQNRVCLNYKDEWRWYMINLRRYSCKVLVFSDVSQNRKVCKQFRNPSDGSLSVPL
jgi:hypothetical protein